MKLLITESQYKQILNYSKSILEERTLYHGTLRSNIPSIEKYGLQGGVGEFVQDMYAEYLNDTDDEGNTYYNPEESDPLVFAADKDTLEKAVTAITHHVAKKLNKDFHSVTDEEFKNYGALVVMKDDKYWNQRKENDYEEYPIFVEPGDYYTESSGIDYILTGQKMTNLFRKYGLFPIETFNEKNKAKKIKCLYNTVLNTIKRTQDEDLIKLKGRLEEPEFLNQIKGKWFDDVKDFFLRKGIFIDC
jgi:hypothetical protein